MNELSKQLKELLLSSGAGIAGFGDISDICDNELTVGVVVAIPMPKEMVESITLDPTQEYRQWYHETNARLDEIISKGAAFLREKGYDCDELLTSKTQRSEDQRTKLPYKSIAVRAGLGFIGKSCLLVTPEYGGALRMAAMTTNAPLSVVEPCFEPKCGDCRKCLEICPYDALKGTQWEKGIERSELFEYEKCVAGTSARCREILGVDMTICGKCFVVCPYTRKYVD